MTGRHKRVEPADTDSTGLDPAPAEPATGPADISLTKAAAEAADRTADTGPQSRRLEAAIEQTQPVPAIGENRLRTAANLLRHTGRCTRRLIDPAGCMCPIGALAVTAGIAADQLDEYERKLADGDDLSLMPPITFTVNRMPEAHHLAAVVRASGSEWAARTSAPTWTLWYWADRVDDDEVLRLLDAAADTFEAVPA